MRRGPEPAGFGLPVRARGVHERINGDHGLVRIAGGFIWKLNASVQPWRFFTKPRGRKEGRRRIFPAGLFLFPAEFPNSGSVITGSADAGWQRRVEAGPDSGRESLRTLSSRRNEPPALLFLQLKERRKNSPVFLENASEPVSVSASTCTARIFAIVYS